MTGLGTLLFVPASEYEAACVPGCSPPLVLGRWRVFRISLLLSIPPLRSMYQSSSDSRLHLSFSWCALD